MYLVVSDNQNLNTTYLEPKHFSDYNSKRVQIKYGPYDVPPNYIENGIMSPVELDATPPCHDCLLTLMQANLIYPDGTTANRDTGMLLHHSNAFNPGREDLLGCMSLGELFFASGNERTTVDFSLNE